MDELFDYIARVIASPLPRRVVLKHVSALIPAVLLASCGYTRYAVTPTPRECCRRFCSRWFKGSSAQKYCRFICDQCQGKQQDVCIAPLPPNFPPAQPGYYAVCCDPGKTCCTEERAIAYCV